jgi:GNAT superfamily N-acetyltransferase
MMDMPVINTRLVGPDDLDLIVRHRTEMFRESGCPEEDLATMTAGFRPWLELRLAGGTYFGWVMEAGGDAVAGLGMIVLDWPPHMFHPSDARRGYVLNVFVEPEYRGRGLASELMKVALAEAERRGIAFMTLHASSQGRPLYEKLGWKPTSEMSFVTGATKDGASPKK